MATRFVAEDTLGAVSGNPRVSNTTTMLAHIQAMEFSASVGTLRRTDSIWGRLVGHGLLGHVCGGRRLLHVARAAHPPQHARHLEHSAHHANHAAE